MLAGFFMRFTIRDLMWLTVVMAMGVGWITDHRSTSALRAEAASLRWQLTTLIGLANERGLSVSAADGEVSLGGDDQRETVFQSRTVLH
jgi:hypothetical protein